MKPDPDRLLEVAGAHLMGRVGPALGPGYEQSSVGALAVLLLVLREELERGASRRVEENAALRQLFTDAQPHVADAGLRARLAAAARGEDDDLALSKLEAANAALRGLLIELHAHVEGLDGDGARRATEAIWRELARSTERRRLSFAVF